MPVSKPDRRAALSLSRNGLLPCGSHRGEVNTPGLTLPIRPGSVAYWPRSISGSPCPRSRFRTRADRTGFNRRTPVGLASLPGLPKVLTSHRSPPGARVGMAIPYRPIRIIAPDRFHLQEACPCGPLGCLPLPSAGRPSNVRRPPPDQCFGPRFAPLDSTVPVTSWNQLKYASLRTEVQALSEFPHRSLFSLESIAYTSSRKENLWIKRGRPRMFDTRESGEPGSTPGGDIRYIGGHA